MKYKANLYFFPKQFFFFNHIDLIFYKNVLLSLYIFTLLVNFQLIKKKKKVKFKQLPSKFHNTIEFLSKGNRSNERLSESFLFLQIKIESLEIGQENLARLTTPSSPPSPSTKGVATPPLAREILGEALGKSLSRASTKFR